ncbi:hypothetical protein DNTS_001286, partial [Danionella cerebrum]
DGRLCEVKLRKVIGKENVPIEAKRDCSLWDRILFDRVTLYMIISELSRTAAVMMAFFSFEDSMQLSSLA